VDLSLTSGGAASGPAVVWAGGRSPEGGTDLGGPGRRWTTV